MDPRELRKILDPCKRTNAKVSLRIHAPFVYCCILCIQVLHLAAPWLEPGLQPPARVSRNRCVLAPVCHGVALNPGPGDHRVLCIVCIAFDLVVDWDARTSAIAESYSAYRASEMNNYG